MSRFRWRSAWTKRRSLKRPPWAPPIAASRTSWPPIPGGLWLRSRRTSARSQGWGLFATQLGYKLDWRGGHLITVPAAYTSQTCAVCGHVHADNRQGEDFRCRACGHTDHADVNAAKNILAAGRAVLAGAERSAIGRAGVEDARQSARPMKRQPTEERAHAI